MSALMHWLGNYNLSLVYVVFNMLIMAGYLLYRSWRKPNPVSLLSLLLQGVLLTLGAQIVLGRVLVVPFFEIVLIIFGNLMPGILLLSDLVRMTKHAAQEGVTPVLVPKKPVSKSSWSEDEWVKTPDMPKPDLSAKQLQNAFETSDSGVRDNIQMQLTRTLQEVDQGNCVKALASLQTLNALVSLKGQALVLLGWLFLRDRQPDEANAIFQQLLSSQIKSAKKNGKFGKAEEQDLDGYAYLGIGAADYMRDRYEIAMFHLEKATADPSCKRDALTNLSRCALMLRDEYKAAEYLEEALKPVEDAKLLFMLAKVKRASETRMGAISALRRAVALDASFEAAWELLATLSKEEGQIEQVVKCHQALVSCDAYNPNYQLGLADALRAADESSAAIAAYRRAIDLMPESSRAQYGLAVLLSASGKKEEAVRLFRKALAGDNPFENIYHQLAGTLFEQGKVVESIAVYQEAASLYPQSGKVFYNLGVAYMEANRDEEASHAFHTACALGESDEAMVDLWAKSLAAQNQYYEMSRMLREALEKIPGNLPIMFWLARARARQKNAVEAISLLQQIVAASPETKMDIRDCADFSILRNDPDFIRLIRMPLREGAIP